MPANSPPLTPGLAVIHANRLENLRELTVSWIRQHPLQPLENEVILVQSNGMAQWLKLALAAEEGLGICAAVEVSLPARFLWRTYQSVLPDLAVPEVSPFDKTDMSWRIFRQLPGLLHDPRFAALQRFLADADDTRKRYQLAECLADLFDQYQVYRADWLADWADGHDQLRDAHGQVLALPTEQTWQPALWRVIVADVGDALRPFSRAGLHQQFLAALEQATLAPPGLPRRVIVFGISSLPQQTLEAFQALSRFCQILLCVNNPCQYYWADIIEHKELLRSQRRRHPSKLPANLSDEELHLHANPLLAAWGKQGRDYIGLLDAIDEPEHYRPWFQRIDVFEDYLASPDSGTLLQRLQQAILDLSPLPSEPSLRPAIDVDNSLVFHLAHSPQREVEILHDQLLALFADAAAQNQPLAARDILIMTPDIDRYAPHIRAVFGQIEPSDPRYIPFSVTDQRERGQNPLLIALEALLQLPESRFSVSDLLDLLDVPAIRQRFAIDEARLPTLTQWIAQAGIRWGLHAAQRETLGMPAGLEQNTWRFGFRRMLLGYAVGAGEAWEGIEPYDEIGGLDAALLGPLMQLLDALEQTWQEIRSAAEPVVWSQRFNALLQRFFAASNDRELLTLDNLTSALDQWDALFQRVALTEPLPLNVVREVWLSGIDQPSLSQRFLAGRVNFCTLMPMRSIPFQVVCLLGMNDGDFPRQSMALSFDLMSSVKSYRPGDRSRRDDDRYLFLEALLSARRRLYISWIGHSVQDNAERAPSLLVGQLRDYLLAGWQAKHQGQTDGGDVLLQQLTTHHPLQAFSRRYFARPDQPGYDARLFSYAKEWQAALAAPAPPVVEVTLLEPLPLDAPLTLDLLAGFLRHPVKAFFNQRLKVWLEDSQLLHEDSETFAFDGLQQFALGHDLLQAALNAAAGHSEQAFAEQMQKQQRLGVLPLAGFAGLAQSQYAGAAWRVWQRAEPLLQHWQTLDEPLAISLSLRIAADSTVVLEDWVSGLRHNQHGQIVQILTTPQTVLDKQQRPKYHNLLRAWLKHLAACAMAVELTTLQVGVDAIVELPRIEPAQARAWLQGIAQAWWWNMRTPLPLACKTAFAWLGAADDKQLQAAEKVYTGDGFQTPGEVDQDRYLARQFADLEQLLAVNVGGDFKDWLERLYLPLWQQAKLRENDA